MSDARSVCTPGSGHVVFVYSCFRAASTWFWSRLRAHRQLCCYYEVFNEQLEHVSLADLSSARPENWRSHHPDTGPYLTEFASLLGTEPGIAGFPVESPLGSRFLGAAGIEGALDHEVEAYLRRLVASAQASGRVPVITDTRLLGRVAGLRAAFGGTHILLVRNLFEQWNSVSGQVRTGNDYFLRMVFNQLDCGRQDAFFAYLMTMFGGRGDASFEAWTRDANADAAFCCYVASRIYLLVVARRHCDLVVDVTSLGDPGQRATAERALTRLLGVDIDLADYAQRVDYPKWLIRSSKDCRALLAELVERGLADARASDDERAYAARLIEATWEAHQRFTAYTTGARECIAQDARRIAELDKAQRALAARVQELEEQAARRAAEASALRQTAEARRQQAETLDADLRNAKQALASLEARLAEAQRQPR